MNSDIRAEILSLRKSLAAAPSRVIAELSGLNPEQMAFSQGDPVWARWSADMQERTVRIMARRKFAHIKFEARKRIHLPRLSPWPSTQHSGVA